jgi:hypothetical protein
MSLDDSFILIFSGSVLVAGCWLLGENAKNLRYMQFIPPASVQFTSLKH